jgi:arsenate reductase
MIFVTFAPFSKRAVNEKCYYNFFDQVSVVALETPAMSIKIYHNPRCSKSRETLQLLRDRGIEPEIVEYLKTPPSAQELNAILQKLGMEPRDLMRKKEAPYDENDLLDPSLDRRALIQAMVRFPILIERPIVVNGDKAAIGRPPEKVLAIL